MARFAAGTPDQLKPGAKVFVIAHKPDGKVGAAAIVVGKDGLRPPMYSWRPSASNGGI